MIESVQRNFTRRIPEVARQNCGSYQGRLEYLKLDSLEMRRLKADLILTYKIINQLVDVDFEAFFKRVNPGEDRTRTNGFKLVKPECTKRVREQFFCVRVVRVWNDLDHSTVFAPTIQSFKARLNKETEKLTNFLSRADY